MKSLKNLMINELTKDKNSEMTKENIFKTTIHKNVFITTKDEQFLGYIEIDSKGKIQKIKKGYTRKIGIDCKKNFLLPGFIDGHTHGGYGFAFNDILDQDGEEKFLKYQFQVAKNEGVVASVFATVSESWDKLKKCL